MIERVDYAKGWKAFFSLIERYEDAGGDEAIVSIRDLHEVLVASLPGFKRVHIGMVMPTDLELTSQIEQATLDSLPVRANASA